MVRLPELTVSNPWSAVQLELPVDPALPPAHPARMTIVLTAPTSKATAPNRLFLMYFS
jgi:hypothetical protein